MGPSILGTALNPSLSAPPSPIGDDDVVEPAINVTTPANLTEYEPDEEFESLRTNTGTQKGIGDKN